MNVHDVIVLLIGKRMEDDIRLLKIINIDDDLKGVRDGTLRCSDVYKTVFSIYVYILIY